MHPSLRLAVELPPVPAGGRAGTTSLEPWWQMALASVRAGAGVVWFTAGSTPDGSPGHAPGCDPCTIAAAAVSLVDTALLGVVSAIPGDRHPAVLARDVTTLDIVSGGRAAVLLRWAGTVGLSEASEASEAGTAVSTEAGTAVSTEAGTAVSTEAGTAVPAAVPADPGRLERGPSAACEHLGEAVAVCASVLRDDRPVFEGSYLHVAGAVNLPPPRRPGGPLLLAEAPAGAVGLARREAGPAFLLRQASSAAAAIACPDDPGEIASWRALLEDVAASPWAGGDPGEVPAVVCRTTLHSGRSGSEPRGMVERVPSSRPQPAVRSRLTAAREAGADGVIVRLPWGRRADQAFHLEVGDSDRIADELAACFEPWRR